MKVLRCRVCCGWDGYDGSKRAAGAVYPLASNSSSNSSNNKQLKPRDRTPPIQLPAGLQSHQLYHIRENLPRRTERTCFFLSSFIRCTFRFNSFATLSISSTLLFDNSPSFVSCWPTFVPRFLVHSWRVKSSKQPAMLRKPRPTPSCHASGQIRRAALLRCTAMLTPLRMPPPSSTPTSS